MVSKKPTLLRFTPLCASASRRRLHQNFSSFPTITTSNLSFLLSWKHGNAAARCNFCMSAASARTLSTTVEFVLNGVCMGFPKAEFTSSIHIKTIFLCSYEHSLFPILKDSKVRAVRPCPKFGPNKKTYFVIGRGQELFFFRVVAQLFRVSKMKECETPFKHNQYGRNGRNSFQTRTALYL